jgi:transposase
MDPKLLKVVEYLYFKLGLSLRDTAKVVGISQESVRKWILKTGKKPREWKYSVKHRRPTKLKPDVRGLRETVQTLFGIKLPLTPKRKRKRRAIVK